MQDAAGEITLPDREASPSQDSIPPSPTKQPRRQHPVPHASILRQSQAPEGPDVKTPPETPPSSERANHRLTSENEQRNQGGGTVPLQLTGNEQQQQGPRRSDASIEMVVLSPGAGDADLERSDPGSEVTESAGNSSSSEAIVESQGESRLLIFAPLLREDEKSSITGAAEDFKHHKDPDLTEPTLSLQGRHTERVMINVSAPEMKETQPKFDRRENTVFPKSQTSPQHADAETEAGDVETEDMHAHTVLENHHYDNARTVFKKSPQPSLMTGDPFLQSTQQTVASVYQPPTGTVTRKGAKLRPGVRGQRVRLWFYFFLFSI